MSAETEAFWTPIVMPAVTDFKDLRLQPPMVHHENDEVWIIGLGGPLAKLTRHAAMLSDDPTGTLIELARVVAPKGETCFW